MFELKPLLDPRSQVLSVAYAIELKDAWQSSSCVLFEPDDRADKGHKIRSIQAEALLGPKGKRGEDLRLVGQFNFKSIMGVEDTLNLYLSPDYRNYQPKERGWNLLTLDPPSSIKTEGWLNSWAKLALDLSASETRQRFRREEDLILSCDVNPAEALNIAAFHANGISHSPARANDPHYGHLLESARNWFVLLAIREKNILDQETSRILYVCMTKDDFSNKAFGNCQLVFV
ncbi:MAG: hypothetical protein IPG59_21345 [Candidatus Melainabacteria bacterium]|nr:MAG: hypothetical protein IPG59_21345 [Candidatus Melainabacteria bacterium]